MWGKIVDSSFEPINSGSGLGRSNKLRRANKFKKDSFAKKEDCPAYKGWTPFFTIPPLPPLGTHTHLARNGGGKRKKVKRRSNFSRTPAGKVFFRWP